ncbi:MAG: phage antirepressor N-terminal domain-containing protein [Pseudomonadota bacterium]|nr:phage antirepressor N-terminal domain-containing protein [Pseudomonadota bacterium]
MNTITTIDFNGQPLITIEQDGIHYTAVKPICENIGLNWDAQRKRISRDDVLSEGAVIMTAPSKGGNQEMLCLPIDYLNGWLFGVDAKRVKPEIKDTLIQYKKECYKVLHDYWHTGAAIDPRTNQDLPSSVKDRNGLVKAAHITQYKLGIGYDDVFSLIHHRFNVDKLGDLTVSQVGEATEYIQRMRYPQLTEKPHTEHAQDAQPIEDEDQPAIEHGTATKMANQVLASGKFIGTIDSNGRMVMRELDAEEVVITVDMIPHLIEQRKINVNVLSRIALNATQQLYAATYGLRSTQNAALAQGEYHDSI